MKSDIYLAQYTLKHHNMLLNFCKLLCPNHRAWWHRWYFFPFYRWVGAESGSMTAFQGTKCQGQHSAWVPQGLESSLSSRPKQLLKQWQMFPQTLSKHQWKKFTVLQGFSPSSVPATPFNMDYSLFCFGDHRKDASFFDITIILIVGDNCTHSPTQIHYNLSFQTFLNEMIKFYCPPVTL